MINFSIIICILHMHRNNSIYIFGNYDKETELVLVGN